MQNDERGQWILANHPGAQSEFAITAMLNGKVEKLIIDRTFIDAAGTRWIIDYKTTLLQHSDMDQFLEKEQAKYLAKMQTYHDAMQLIEQRPTRLGLYFLAYPAWHEWQL